MRIKSSHHNKFHSKIKKKYKKMYSKAINFKGLLTWPLKSSVNR